MSEPFLAEFTKLANGMSNAINQMGVPLVQFTESMRPFMCPEWFVTELYWMKHRVTSIPFPSFVRLP